MNVPSYLTMQQCDKVRLESITMPYVKSIYSCRNRIMGNGYTDSFEPAANGLQSKSTGRVYPPKEVKIVNFFRFEGNANAADNILLYVIETTDGRKGTMEHLYDTYHERLSGNLFVPGNGTVE